MLLALVVLAALTPLGSACKRDIPETKPAPISTPPSEPASYVGGEKCVTCHAAEAELWRGSHHALAMQPATAQTVLADFENAKFSKDGIESRFFRRDGQYWVRTDGADGKLTDFRVTYTFGVTPLQQYLLELPGGRKQALSIAWDSRAKEQGGQRWFHLYPDEKIDHRDVLHWTGPAQNWNHMCAECHSTNLQKNYRPASGRFETTWTDINVNCEACHGPASRHLAWAQAAKRTSEAGFGLVEPLSGAGGLWVFKEGDPIARRSVPLATPDELETCGRCHSRRAQIWPDYVHGQPLEQSYRVALLEEDLYQADGQILDEVYEYGSFLQSRMHAAGVTCSSCHDAHSGQLRAPGNAMCGQCHLGTHYDTDQHHHHAAGSAASQCVSCHMPERNYMVIDGRRDHSLRVPRPDLSVKLGTPNACSGCHAARGDAWAAATVVQWYGSERKRGARYAEALQLGRRGSPAAEQALATTAGDAALPVIVRASALALLSRFLSPSSLPVVERALRDPEALVRRAALEGLQAMDPPARVPLVSPLLSDPIRSVRLEALGLLLDVPPSARPSDRQRELKRAIDEYRAIQSFNADRADAQTNLGLLEARLGNAPAAQRAYETAISLQPSFAPAHLDLADLFRASGEEQRAELALRDGLRANPGHAPTHQALGLALVRQKRLDEALSELELAARLQPDVPRFAFVHAVALHDLGNLKGAIAALQRAQQRNPADRELLSALSQYHLEAGDRPGALRWARQLAQVVPDDPGVQRLLQQLQQ